MNTFTTIYQDESGKYDAQNSLGLNPEAIDTFFNVMWHDEIPECFKWLSNMLASLEPTIRRDLFNYKNDEGDAIAHKLYDYHDFLEAVEEYLPDIDLFQEGKICLTPLEIAAIDVLSDTFEHMLNIGFPPSSLRDISLLWDVSFDGRDASDIAASNDQSIDELIQDIILYRLNLLEENGYTIPDDTKDMVRTLEFPLSF